MAAPSGQIVIGRSCVWASIVISWPTAKPSVRNEPAALRVIVPNGVLGTRAGAIVRPVSRGSGFGPKSWSVIWPGVPPYQRPACDESPLITSGQGVQVVE